MVKLVRKKTFMCNIYMTCTVYDIVLVKVVN